MHIKCWGSRGSIPVCGEEYLKYGGNTTCIGITADSGDEVIIDAGTGIRRLGIDPYYKNINKYNLLFTHFHWDHVIGFNFFKPILEKNKTLLIQNTGFSGLFVKDILSDLMKPPFFPVTMDDLEADIKFTDDDHDGKFSIGSLDIESISLSHPGGGFGYKFTENGKSFVFLTDNELGFDHPGTVGFDSYMDFSKNADILFHDGEFTPDEYPSKTGWGHSSYTDALNLAIKARVKKLGLFHINQERQDYEMDEIIDKCTKIIKQRHSSLKCFGVANNMEFHL